MQCFVGVSGSVASAGMKARRRRAPAGFFGAERGETLLVLCVMLTATEGEL